MPGAIRTGATAIDPKKRPRFHKHLNWDLWLGPAPYRPYHPAYHPASLGENSGTSATEGSAISASMSSTLPFWALGLKHPTSVEAEGPPVNPEGTPQLDDCTLDVPRSGRICRR